MNNGLPLAGVLALADEGDDLSIVLDIPGKVGIPLVGVFEAAEEEIGSLPVGVLGRDPLTDVGFSGNLGDPVANDCLAPVGILVRDPEDAVGRAKRGVLEVRSADVGLPPEVGVGALDEDASFRVFGVFVVRLLNEGSFFGTEIGAGRL